MNPESINSVYALFDSFGAILSELLIAGHMGPVDQPNAYKAVAGVLVKRGKGHLFQENMGRKAPF